MSGGLNLYYLSISYMDLPTDLLGGSPTEHLHAHAKILGLGEVEAASEEEAIETGAEKFGQDAKRLIAAVTRG